MVLDLRHTQPVAAGPYDVCIIGGGTVGLPLAAALSRHGHRVIVVERGGSSQRTHESFAVRGEGSTYQGASAEWGSALGGASRVWGGRLVPLDTELCTDRRALGLRNWPIVPSELTRHTAAIENLFELPPGVFDTPGAVVADDGPGHKHGDAMVAIRSPVIVPRARRDVSRTLVSDPDFKVLTHAAATDFDVDRESGRLDGIRVASETGTATWITARHFVLATGALEATRLLLWLNRRVDDRMFDADQGLGISLVDHVALAAGTVTRYQPRTLSTLLGMRSVGGARRAIHFEIAPALQRRYALPGIYLNFQLRYTNAEQMTRVREAAIACSSRSRLSGLAGLFATPSDLAHLLRMARWSLLKTAGGLSGAMDVIAQVVVEQVPGPGTCVTLSDRKDRHGIPLARIDWQASDRDLRNGLCAQQVFEAYWARSGLANRCTVAWQQAETNPRRLQDVFHPCGLIPMGTDPHSSVVNPDLTCHAIGNLSVLSTAVFPSAGNGNPTLPLLQLTYRLAAHLTENALDGDAARLTAAS